jgi:esterase
MIAYEVYGRGPIRALALHGLFGGGESFAPMLAGIDPDRWSLAVPDLRGYVRSRDAGGPYDMLTAAQDVLAVADELGWQQFALIGHSMGGKIALRVACLAPSRVTRVAGLSALWAAAVPFGADALAFFRSSVDNIEARQAIIALSTGRRLPVAWCRTMAQASATGTRPEAYASYLEAFVHDDFAADAGALEIDALLVSGAWDSDASRVQREGWQNGMRRLETVVLEECGHWAIHEAPLLTAAILEGFLARE